MREGITDTIRKRLMRLASHKVRTFLRGAAECAVATGTAAILFSPASPAFVGAVAAISAVIAARGAITFWRTNRRAALFNLIFMACIIMLSPFILKEFLDWRAGTLFMTDVDHLPVPNQEEWNSDSIRFRGEAGDVKADDYNILILGDSFAHGYRVKYEESWPYVVEAFLHESYVCDRNVRAISMGWTSSSPLLGLRRLKVIGSKYKPSLIVYALDLTDFSDDIQYERQLVERVQLNEFSTMEVLSVVASRWATSLLRSERFAGVLGSLRPSLRNALVWLSQLSLPSMEERFMIVRQPLEQSMDLIERGVKKNLMRMQAYAAEDLSSAFFVVLIPRAFQYNDDEASGSWERDWYKSPSVYRREANRYFAQNQLPFTVLDLLPVFESSHLFPLYFEDDPHWNAEGNRLAALAVTEYLIRNHYVPCKRKEG